AIRGSAHQNHDRYDKTINPIVACAQMSGGEGEKGNREGRIKSRCRSERHDAAHKVSADTAYNLGWYGAPYGPHVRAHLISRVRFMSPSRESLHSTSLRNR